MVEIRGPGMGTVPSQPSAEGPKGSGESFDITSKRLGQATESPGKLKVGGEPPLFPDKVKQTIAKFEAWMKKYGAEVPPSRAAMSELTKIKSELMGEYAAYADKAVQDALVKSIVSIRAAELAWVNVRDPSSKLDPSMVNFLIRKALNSLTKF